MLGRFVPRSIALICDALSLVSAASSLRFERMILH